MLFPWAFWHCCFTANRSNIEHQFRDWLNPSFLKWEALCYDGLTSQHNCGLNGKTSFAAICLQEAPTSSNCFSELDGKIVLPFLSKKAWISSAKKSCFYFDLNRFVFTKKASKFVLFHFCHQHYVWVQEVENLTIEIIAKQCLMVGGAHKCTAYNVGESIYETEGQN